MREIVIFAGLLLGAGVVAARVADQAMHTTAPPPAVAAVASVPPVAVPHDSSGGGVVVPRDARGHFVVDARVDGRRMGFMLDTGASVVALRARDAAGLGIHPVAREYTDEVKTANGSTRAAPVQLGMVEINGITVHNVAALVSPDEALGENLLGLSFLSRLRRFEYSNGRMVLEQ
jgi:aspartyl protease family protein